MNRNETVELVTRAQEGDNGAFEQLYEKYRERLCAFARKNVGSREAAEDIVSETFMTAMQKIGELRSPEAFGAWLYSIAYNLCCKHLDSESRQIHFDDYSDLAEAVDQGLNEPVMLPCDYAENADTRRRLGEIIDSMTKDMRAAVILYYYNEQSLDEIARTLGTNRNSVKQKLSKARKNIRKRVEKLIGSGAEFVAVPLGAVLNSSLDDNYVKSAVSGAVVKSKPLGVKIAAVGAIAAVAVAVPIVLSRIGGGGDARDKLNLDSVQQELETYHFTDTENLHFECEPIKQELGKVYTIDIQTVQNVSDEEKVRMKQRVIELGKDILGMEIDPDDVKEDGTAQRFDGEYKNIPANVYVSANHSASVMTPEYVKAYNECKTDEKSPIYDTDSYVLFNGRNEVGRTFEIDGREVNIQKAGEYARQYIAEHFPDIFNEGESLEVADVTGVKDENGKYHFLEFRLAFAVDGIRVNENGIFSPYAASSKELICQTYVYVDMNAETSILDVSPFMHFNIVGKKEVKEIISLSEAVEMASEGLAPNSKYTVRDVRLKYAEHALSKDPQKEYDPEEFEKVREMRPMWCFVLGVKGGQHTMTVQTKDLFIDAIDGTMYYSDSERYTCDVYKPK